MEVVINKCYGGFGISPQAIIELVKINSKVINAISASKYYGELREYEYKKDYSTSLNGFFIHRFMYNVMKDDIIYTYNSADESRTNKDLIDVVRKLGKDANGSYADLHIVYVPDNVNWHISEYDGIERIDEDHQSWS